MPPTLISLSVGFLVLGAVFYLIERLFPAIPGQPLWRRGTRTDLIYWFFTPLVTKVLSSGLTLVAVALAALAMGRRLGPDLTAGFGPVARQSGWAVALEMLVLGDLVGYWTHRAFHGRRLWKFHAIHHGSTQVDWLSSVRLHPVNDGLSRASQAVVLLCLGFPLKALAAYVPFLTLYALFLHANVGWSFGPLRFVVASPVFHRWHHTSEEEGLDKNFAGLLPVFDLLFGTFYMPPGRQPELFGVAGEVVPEGFLAQLAYPFRRGRESVPRGPR
jgi:sterol desaturase/sphingolipid hydroxylase (fatty acid hydroxylase superfamily)